MAMVEGDGNQIQYGGHELPGANMAYTNNDNINTCTRTHTLAIIQHRVDVVEWGDVGRGVRGS